MLTGLWSADAARPSLSVGDSTYTYGDLRRLVGAYASLLAEHGVSAGDRVAVWTQRDPLTPVALVAQAALGITSVPLNPALGASELEHILSDAAPSLALAADPADLPSHAPAALRIDLDAKAAAAPAASPTQVPFGTDTAPALILYTSGTTGKPKGAMLSANNVAHNLDGLAQAWALTPDDTIVHSLPLFHVHGLVLGLYGAMRTGAALRWVPRFSPTELLRAMRVESAVLFAVPTLYHRLGEHLSEHPEDVEVLSQARLLVSGSAGLPRREHARIKDLTGRDIIERYGLTETLINTAVPHEAPDPGYVGFPVGETELILVDDQRVPLDAHDDNTIGEVAVRGPSVFLGYLNRPDATAAAMDDNGFFFTGDLATRKPDGAIRIVGRRATDLIKTGGFKVGAGEVEASILELPAIREVAVVGVPDSDLGERIVAFIVPRDGVAPPDGDLVIAHVAQQLSHHKRPRDVHCVDALPKNSMGKVMKRRLLG